MNARLPIAELRTHEVTNQPPPFEDFNLFTSDRALVDAVKAAGGAAHLERLTALGARAGSAEVLEWGNEANRNPPVLQRHDRYGHRIDEVKFHPHYHRLMDLAIGAGQAAIAWDGTPAGHVAHAAILFVTGQVDSGTSCPITMTYASVPALRAEKEVADEWVPRILSATYDPASRPAAEKAGVTIGMAMTEKQGGSDVRANTTRAEPTDEADWYALTGHKWFCSAPMCDAFLALAWAPGGLTCFLLPRWLPDGTRNAGFEIVALKDKMGDRSNASSEVEFHGALARRVGEEGKGVQTIIRMVQHTRLDCAVGSAAQMRSAVAHATWHAAHRTAFQKKLIDQPAMTALLADLAIESEAATAMAMRAAQAFDEEDPLARLLTPIAKYWICQRAPNLVFEAMQAHGGAGYVETGPMPRLFRQSPLNSIWEGSGNVIALDVLRAWRKEPEAVDALQAWLDGARGQSGEYDSWLDGIDSREAAVGTEATARWTVEKLAIASQAAVLIGWENPVAEAYCATRMGTRGMSYGAIGDGVDVRGVVERAMPLKRR